MLCSIIKSPIEYNSTHPRYVIGNVRRGAPNTLIGSGINPGAYESQERALQIANEIRGAGADIIYCSGLVPDKFAGLARQHFPCCGHVGCARVCYFIHYICTCSKEVLCV